MLQRLHDAPGGGGGVKCSCVAKTARRYTFGASVMPQDIPKISVYLSLTSIAAWIDVWMSASSSRRSCLSRSKSVYDNDNDNDNEFILRRPLTPALSLGGSHVTVATGTNFAHRHHTRNVPPFSFFHGVSS